MIENNAAKSGKIVYNERMNEVENKAVEAIISPTFTDKVRSLGQLNFEIFTCL